jgi:hypothetical protein
MPDLPHLLRVSSPASDLELNLSLNIGASQYLAAGDVRWLYRDAADNALDTDVFLYACDSGEWTGDFFRVPDAPTSFSGTSTFGTNPYGGPYRPSEVKFRAPAGARYVAAVRPRQGAVSLSLNRGGRVTTFASPGTHDLGFVSADETVLLGIEPNDGPPAIWDVSITPLPIRFGSASVNRAYARPGQLVTMKYSVSGDAKLDAVVRGQGRVVRQLAAATKVAAGSHSIRWDGVDDTGKPVADGVYSIDLTAGDIFSSTAKTAASVTIDTHPPEVTFQSPSVLSPRRGVVFKIVDRLSGYRNGFVKVDGRSSGFQITRAGVNRFVVTAPSGWTPGSHSVTVTAFDKIGNRGNTSKTFRVR